MCVFKDRALRQHNMSPEYLPVRQNETWTPDGPDEKSHEWVQASDKRRKTPLCAYAVIIFLLMTNVVSIIVLDWYTLQPSKCAADRPIGEASIPQIEEQYRQFWWNTGYSSRNQSEQDDLWEQIRWTHGMIQADKHWAESQHWPRTMDNPNDHTKGVWLLEAYHEVHCLGVLRRVMSQTFAGSPPSGADEVVTSHVAHCFDYLLQVAMCNADSTPLYVTGKTQVGQGQSHRCKDWTVLRDFASENSACYDEFKGGEDVNEHFGWCGNEGDGLVLP